MKNVSTQILKEVQECLKQHGFPQLDTARQDTLKGQIESLADSKQSVQQLMS